MSIRSCVAIFVLVVPGLLCAQDKKAALADELLTVMKADRMIDQAKQEVPVMIQAQIKQLNLPDSAKPKVDQLMQDMLAYVNEMLDWKKMKLDYVKIYSETFTEQELQTVVDFYKSPGGQAFLAKMPEVMTKSMQLQQRQTSEMMAHLQEAMKKVQAADAK